MSNAYAERYRILPVALSRATLTVATGEPFVRAWADELEKILKVSRSSSSSPTRRTSAAISASSSTLARSMKKARGRAEGRLLARAQFRAAGRARQATATSTPTISTSSTSSTGCGNTRSTSARRTSTSSRGATSGLVRFRIDGVLHQVYAIPNPVLIAMTSRIKLLARMEIVERRRPQDGRIKTRVAGRRGDRAAHLDDADRVRREGRHADLHARRAGARFPGPGLHRRRPRALGAR